MTGQEVIRAATEVAFALLKNGAEIYRVEQTVSFICRAYGFTEVHAFALHSTIFVSVNCEGTEISTKIRRTYVVGSDFDKVDRLNALSRYICENKPEYDEIMEKLSEIRQAKGYPDWVEYLAGAVTAFFFTLFFKGNYRDALSAGIIGMLLEVGLHLLKRLEPNVFISSVLGAIFSTFMARLSVLLGLADSVSAVNIGVLMLLVPGLALTTSMRDFLASDYVSGMAKLSEALITAVCIAVGVTVVGMIW